MNRFGAEQRWPEWYYAGESHRKKTFRFPEKTNRNFFAPVTIYRLLLSRLINRQKGIRVFTQGREAIYDIHLRESEFRQEYVRHFLPNGVALAISKEQLIASASGLEKLNMTVFAIPALPFLLLMAVFSKNRLSAPLTLIEIFELYCLHSRIKQYKIKKLHWFCIYERDANIGALLLKRSGVYVNKIPSEVPLVFANKIIIANELSFCFGYQKEEFDTFRQTMFVERTNQWAPEQFFQSLNSLKLQASGGDKGFGKIAFFSSGNWLRAMLGHTDLGSNDKENEELILNTLLRFTETGTDLIIFLHPLEKRVQHAELTKRYYEPILAKPNVKLANPEKTSVENFHLADTGVAQYSTLMFERLCLGYKTILAPWGHPQFPLKNSSMENCCAFNEQQLIDKLKMALGQTNNEFFESNNLQKYICNTTWN